MSSAASAKSTASRYINTNLSGTVTDVDFVGMTDTSSGKRLGYRVVWDEGYSIGGAVLGGLLAGLLAILAGILLGLLLLIVGFPPQLFVLLAGLGVLGAVYVGAQGGGDATEVELVTLTVDASGTVVMVNRDLTDGEFSRSIDRQFDRQTKQVNNTISEVSKHWLLHKFADRYIGSNDDK
jgi:hypothetical protein